MTELAESLTKAVADVVVVVVRVVVPAAVVDLAVLGWELRVVGCLRAERVQRVERIERVDVIEWAGAATVRVSARARAGGACY